MIRFPAERKCIFLAGITLILVFSIVIGVINLGVLFLFGVPFLGLIAGMVAIWFARISTSVKIGLSILPVPLIVASFFLTVFFRTAEGETFLIPARYRGQIVVFYSEQCGEPARFDDGRRLYQLSSEGILITQVSRNDGYLNRKFYFLNDDDIRLELPQFSRQDFETAKQDFETAKKEWDRYAPATSSKLTKDTVGAFWAYGRETYHVSKNSIGYLIHNYGWWDRDHKQRAIENNIFTAKAEERLKKCRALSDRRN